MYVEWQGFTEGSWTREINVRDFIQKNYNPYDGNAEFLADATVRTHQLWHQVAELMKFFLLDLEFMTSYVCYQITKELL